jgi:hypothetical protein
MIIWSARIPGGDTELSIAKKRNVLNQANTICGTQPFSASLSTTGKFDDLL